LAGKTNRNYPKEIDSLMAIVGYKKVSIQKQEIIKSDPRIQLNFNAIAKGYCCR
jgi:thiamine biosynthesis lipoprotein